MPTALRGTSEGLSDEATGSYCPSIFSGGSDKTTGARSRVSGVADSGSAGDCGKDRASASFPTSVIMIFGMVGSEGSGVEMGDGVSAGLSVSVGCCSLVLVATGDETSASSGVDSLLELMVF